MPPSILDPLYWNLVERQSIAVRASERIDDFQAVCTSPILMIGVNSQTAKDHWRFAAWASAWSLFLPSSTSIFNPPVGKFGKSHFIELFMLSYVLFPYLGKKKYVCNLAFPAYLKDAQIEIWQWGEDVDGSYVPEFDPLTFN
jgi:hypothetical protein